MPVPPECPEVECLQALLADALPPDQQERCERHLKACPACQERLDRAEECGDQLRRLSQEVGDPTAAPADPALRQVLERLHDVRSSPWSGRAEPVDLYFLRPSDRPGVLGTLGGYEVEGVIGQGGMGVVLKAFDPALHRLVAIKVMAAAVAGSATARRRFTREAQAAAAVCHDHIVAVHGVSESDGLPYLVMQYVAGESLEGRLDRTGPLEVTEIVCIGLQTASALAAAHAQGLIHRDIKPANLLLENGLARVKITDFGLARMADDVGLTQAGVVAGTPEYMAPEQARGEALDHRADLFSLGSVLYACCTGLPPFRGATALAVLRRVTDQEPRPIRSLNPDVPAWLEAVVARLLAKDPARRFQSAAEVAALLEGYLAHLRQPATVAAPPLRSPSADGEPAVPAGRPRSRGLAWFRKFLGLGSLVLLATLATEAAIWFAPGATAPQARATDFRQDFRTLNLNSPYLRVVGRAGQADDRGVRLTLPASEGKQPHSGFMTLFAVRGDFDATFSYEVLRADRPATGYGVGVSLYAVIDTKTNDAVSLARRVMPDGTTVFFSDRLKPTDGRTVHQYKSIPSVSPAGKVRLQRVGSTIRYLVADGTDADFVQMDEQEFGTADVADMQVGGDAGGSEAALDARLLSFAVHAAELPGLPAPTAEPAPAPAAAPQAAGKGWLAAAGVLGVVLAVSFVGAALYARRRGRPARKVPEAPAPDGAAVPGSAAPPGAFVCPGCGKKIRVRADFAGKKGKCPQCGQPVSIPAAAEPGRGEDGGQ
jgi:serine/threonine protein kinase